MHKLPFRSWIFCILWIVYCSGCILWGNIFAKIHISLSWFPIPIFIGELLLLAGIFFTWPEIMNSSVKTKRIILVFSIFLFVATVIGFIQYGPLALRHVATLVYVFFAFFLYQHVVKGQILAVIGFVLYMIFLPIRFGFSGNEFYAFSVWVLACFALNITLKRINIEKTKRLICLAIFSLLALPLSSLFHTARTFIVANCASFLCLFNGILMMSKASVVKKIMSLVLFACILLGCVYFLADRNALRSMVNIKDIMSAIKINDQEYARLKKAYKFKEVPAAVYRPVGQADHEINALVKQTEKPPIADPTIIIVNNRAYVPVSDMAKPLIADSTTAKVNNQAYTPVSDMAKLPIADSTTAKVNNQAYTPVSDMAKLPIADHPTIIIVNNQAYALVSDMAKPPILKHTITKAELRSYENAQQNFLFRVFVWKGLFEELFEKRAFLGFGFGKPLIPKTTQVLGWTDRLYVIDGWVSAHNSWFHLIYLFGIIGVFIALSVWFIWGHIFFRAVHNKDFWGVFLCSALFNFMVGACSQPLLEQPHYAIFFWGLWGIVFRRVYVNNGQINA